jgi:hypothetical protein
MDIHDPLLDEDAGGRWSTAPKACTMLSKRLEAWNLGRIGTADHKILKILL